MARSARAEDLAALAMVCAAGALYLSVAWLPLEHLVGLCVADDAFYYLTIGRNLARGLGATFDGVTATNGFHPAFMALTAGLFAALPVNRADLVVHLSLSILALAAMGTGVLVYLIARRTMDTGSALLALGLWLFNPHVLLTTLQGVEAPLATLTLAAACYWLVRTADDPGTRVSRSLGMGALLGLAGLCRTDSALFAACFATAFVLNIWRSGGVRLAAQRTLVLLGSAAAILAPWVAWNLVRFGRLTQDSARAISGLRHTKWAAANELSALPAVVVEKSGRRLLDIAGQLGVGPVGVIVLAAALLLPFWPGRPVATAAGRPPLPARALAAGAATVMLFYGGVFWFGQRWYFLSTLFAVAMLTAWLIFLLGQRLPLPERARRWPAALLGLAGALALTSFVWIGARLFRQGLYPWQASYLQVAKVLRTQLPANARLGSFNAGIYGFVLDDGVVNLDGVVNGQVYQAMKARRLLAYLREQRVTHVLDHPSTVRTYAWFAEPAYGRAFKPLAQFPGDLILLEVLPPEGDHASER